MLLIIHLFLVFECLGIDDLVCYFGYVEPVVFLNLTDNHMPLYVKSVFFLLGSPIKGSRTASAIKGPHLCTPDDIAVSVNKNARLKGVKDSIVTNQLHNNEALYSADLHEKGHRVAKQVVTSQAAKLHWSNYSIDVVYLNILIQVAEQIIQFAKPGKVGQRCTYVVSPKQAALMSSGVVMNWQNPPVGIQVPSCLLPKLAFQILLGVMASDGNLHKAGKGGLAGNINRNPYLELTMTASRVAKTPLGRDYAVLLAAMLEMLGLGYGMIEERYRWYNPDYEGPKSGMYYEYHIIGVRSIEWRILETYWYTGITEDARDKVPHPSTFGMFDNVAWAFAFAGDGGLEKMRVPFLSFQAFGEAGCQVVADQLKKDYGVGPTVRNNSNGSIIALNVPAGNRFFLDILPYLPTSAHYKVRASVLNHYLANSSPLQPGVISVPGVEAIQAINKVLLS